MYELLLVGNSNGPRTAALDCSARSIGVGILLLYSDCACLRAKSDLNTWTFVKISVKRVYVAMLQSRNAL